MQTKTKEVEIPEGMSLMDYAKQTKGIYINLTNLCGRSPATGKYEFRYMLSNKSLCGEKVKIINAGEELNATVIYSCLGTDYRDKKQYREEFKKAIENYPYLLEKREIKTVGLLLISSKMQMKFRKDTDTDMNSTTYTKRIWKKQDLL